MEIRHPPEFEEHQDELQYMIPGDILRVCHKFKDNGDPCSINKDPCLTFTKYMYGWMYHCFRCGLRGYIDGIKTGPDTTLKRMEKQKKMKPDQKKDTSKFEMPFDSVPLMNNNETIIPWEAYWWLRKYGIKADEIKKFGIQYSPAYKRVIIPIYDYQIDLDDNILGKKIVGWCGRDPVEDRPPEERVKFPKYLTKKTKGISRLYYLIPESSSKYIIVVEDILSAIKVNKATGYTTIALLTSSIDTDLMQRMRGFRVFLWLDYDMKEKALQYCSKMNQINIKTEVIATNLDPKCLDLKAIKTKVARRVANHDKNE